MSLQPKTDCFNMARLCKEDEIGRCSDIVQEYLLNRLIVIWLFDMQKVMLAATCIRTTVDSW